MKQTLLVWLRMAFTWPTCRHVRIAPAVWLEVPRGTTDAHVAAALTAYLKGART